MSAKAWEDLLRNLPDAKQMFDAIPGLLANDLPGLVSADGELQERLDSAKKFHARHEFKEVEPKLDGARVFSKDADTQTEMRNEYARYLEAEKHDLELLRERRDYQADRLAEYQRLYDRNANYANQAPDLIDRAGSAGTGGEQLAQELARVLMAAEHAKPLADALVQEYRRIFGEYDSVIRQRETEHAVHVSNLEILDKIQSKPKPNNVDTSARAPQQPGKPNQAAGGRGELTERIRSVVSGSIGGVRANAGVVQSQLWQTQRQLGPYRPTFSQTQTAAGSSGAGWQSGAGGAYSSGPSYDGYWSVRLDGRRN